MTVQLTPRPETGRVCWVSDGDFCSGGCCGAEVLGVTSTAVLTTPDATLAVAAWGGTLQATGAYGSTEWNLVPASTALTLGTLNLSDAAGLTAGEKVVGLYISLYGHDGTLDSVNFDVEWESKDALGITWIGGTPRVDDTGYY